MRSVYNRIGPYDIHQEIGRGGMAVVFLATDTETNQRVALRTVPTYQASDVLAAEERGAELQEQFCRVSGFVPQVYKYGTEADYFYVAMEYLDGENLSQAIRRAPLTETRAVATDAIARAKFRRYWAFLSPGIIVIRWAVLEPLKREAERRARVPGTRRLELRRRRVPAHRVEPAGIALLQRRAQSLLQVHDRLHALTTTKHEGSIARPAREAHHPIERYLHGRHGHDCRGRGGLIHDVRRQARVIPEMMQSDMQALGSDRLALQSLLRTHPYRQLGDKRRGGRARKEGEEQPVRRIRRRTDADQRLLFRHETRCPWSLLTRYCIRGNARSWTSASLDG